MDFLRHAFDPEFIFRNSIYTSVLIGFSCPLVGVYLVLRRLIFMGVALPQISSTGIAIALCVPMWFGIIQPEHAAHSEHLLAFCGSMAFSLIAILVLAALERRGRGLPEGRLGTAYVVSAGLGILLLSKNRYAEAGWLDLLKGEIITVDNADLAITGGALALVLATLGIFHKELLLVSFDRTLAVTLRKNVPLWDTVMYLLIGLTVSVAVLSVGPLIAFGFLLIPVLTVRLFARNMRQFTILSSVAGGILSFIGFWIAYELDWPVGPTDIVLLGMVYGLVFFGHKIFRMFKTKPAEVQKTPAI
jgi:ABC-type Mn2+/Zn2+ transport system permease subunit